MIINAQLEKLIRDLDAGLTNYTFEPFAWWVERWVGFHFDCFRQAAVIAGAAVGALLARLAVHPGTRSISLLSFYIICGLLLVGYLFFIDRMATIPRSYHQRPTRSLAGILISICIVGLASWAIPTTKIFFFPVVDTQRSYELVRAILMLAIATSVRLTACRPRRPP